MPVKQSTHVAHCTQEAKREAEYEKAARAAAAKSPLASLQNLYGTSVMLCLSQLTINLNTTLHSIAAAGDFCCPHSSGHCAVGLVDQPCGADAVQNLLRRSI